MTTYPTVPTGRGSEIVQTSPERCPNGHALIARQCQVTFGNGNPANSTGRGGRMLGWHCRTCGVITWADGTVSGAEPF